MSTPSSGLGRRAAPRLEGGTLASCLWSLVDVEQRILRRNHQLLVAACVLPLLFVLTVPRMVGGDTAGVPFASLFVVGMVGFALVSSTYTTLATTLPVQRDQLVLKRLLGTPATPAVVLESKAISGALVGLTQVVILVGVGWSVYDLAPPAYPVTLAAFVALGVVTFSLLGIAVGGVLADPSPTVVQLPIVAVQFLSGAFVPLVTAPEWLKTMAVVLPMKGMLDGLRAGYLGVDFNRTSDVAGTLTATQVGAVSSLTSQWRGAVVMLTWSGLAIVVARRHCRWERRGR